MLKELRIESQDFEGIVEPSLGLARGSVFTNLYIPYKFDPKMILTGKNDRQKLLAAIDVYGFLINDLTLFLDTHPTCPKVINSLNIAKNEYQKLKKYYEANYGILTICDIGKSTTHIEGPWPWEDKF